MRKVFIVSLGFLFVSPIFADRVSEIVSIYKEFGLPHDKVNTVERRYNGPGKSAGPEDVRAVLTLLVSRIGREKTQYLLRYHLTQLFDYKTEELQAFLLLSDFFDGEAASNLRVETQKTTYTLFYLEEKFPTPIVAQIIHALGLSEPKTPGGKLINSLVIARRFIERASLAKNLREEVGKSFVELLGSDWPERLNAKQELSQETLCLTLPVALMALDARQALKSALNLKNIHEIDRYVKMLVFQKDLTIEEKKELVGFLKVADLLPITRLQITDFILVSLATRLQQPFSKELIKCLVELQAAQATPAPVPTP